MSRDVIYNPRFSISLSASAGSGKTFALVARLVRLLSEGVDPSEVLVVTFTNKAVREMRDRVTESIYGISFINSVSPEYRDRVLSLMELAGIDGFVDISERFRSRVLPRLTYDAPSIRTFDSFFHHLLSMFSFEAGLSYSFDVMSDLERERVFEKAVDLASSVLLSDHNLRKAVFSLLLSLRNYDPVSFIKDNLMRLMDIRSELESVKLNNDVFEAEEKLVKAKCKLCEFLMEYKGLIKKISLGKVERFCSDNSMLLFDTVKDLWDISSYSSLPQEELSSRWRKFKEAASQFVEGKNRLSVAVLLKLMSVLSDSYNRVVKRDSMVSFGDLKHFIFKLFFDRGLAEEKDYLYFRLDSRIKHLLVDEFQDTDVIQWEVIKPIVEEITSGISTRDKSGSFFYVGDPKQAIYRFRGSQSSLFRRPVTDFPGKIIESRLEFNYRSKKTIVNFVNRVFSSVVFKRWGFEYEVSTPKNDDTGYVLVEESEEYKDNSLLNMRVCTLIRTLKEKGIDFDDVTILTRNNKEVEQIAEFLGMKGIPFYKTTSALLCATWEAQVVLNTLKYLAYRNSVYKEVVLSYIDVGHEKEVFGRFGNMINVWDNISLVVNVVRALGLNKYCSSTDIISSVMDAAHAASLSATDFVDFVIAFEDVLNSTKKPSSGSGVSVMTVHQAKGLEFECVVLPFVSYTLSKRGDFIFVRDKNTSCLVDVVKFPSAVDRFYSKRLNSCYQEEIALRMLDEINLLYVAMTRAKSVLCILGYSEKGNMFSVLKDAIGLNGSFEEGTIKPHGVVFRRVSETIDFYPGVKLRYRSGICDDEEYGNLKERFIGEAFHFGMEMIPEFSTEYISEVLRKVEWRYYRYFCEDDLRLLEGMFRNVLTDRRFLGIVNGKVEKEKPFVYNGQLFRVDLLVKSGSGISVVDYKTGPEKQRHYEQIETYMNVVRRVYGRDVRGFLVYVGERISIREVET